jgi:pimeloyl-ACP methyl ester carboxylesterase
MNTGSRDLPAHFIVIVPGYMGSKLRRRSTGETIWVDFRSIPKNPAKWGEWLDGLLRTLAYPSGDLEPAGIMDEVIFVPPWAKQEQYGRLFHALEKMGYQADATRYPERELNVYGFAYDWRQDNAISARQLGAAIERWRGYHPGAQTWIIAHSNGGLVARWYIEKEGGQEHVGRLFLMGSPWDGTPKSMHMLFNGVDMLFRRRFNLFNIPQRSRDLVRTFPSLYQLVPSCSPFLHDSAGQPVDPFADLTWLANDSQRQLLLAGRRFNQDLGTNLSVETLCFFGRKKATTTSGVVHFGAAGRWQSIDWQASEAGDGTVPEHSAVHPDADQKLPFAVSHGDIYVSPAVLEFLEWQLRAQYEVSKAALATPALQVLFDADQDSYSPGQAIAASVQVLGSEDRAGQRRPVSAAGVTVKLAWEGPLPGDEVIPIHPRPVRARLKETAAGQYGGQLRAPRMEGYYRLTAQVKVPGQLPVALDELVTVEEEAPQR